MKKKVTKEKVTGIPKVFKAPYGNLIGRLVNEIDCIPSGVMIGHEHVADHNRVFVSIHQLPELIDWLNAVHKNLVKKEKRNVKNKKQA